MKKTICILTLICMLLSCFAVTASAETVQPLMPDILRELLAGKTFIAQMDGYSSDEAMEHVTLFWQICEQEEYPAEEVEALAVGDTILVGGDSFEIKEISQDEFGYQLNSEYYTIFAYKNDEGKYTIVTDTENRFYATVVSIEVPAPADLRFVDWSDPEAEAPTELTLKDLVTRYENNEIHSIPDNTQITFDADGKLVEVKYTYSPWN